MALAPEKSYPVPANEAERVAKLREFAILDSPPDCFFDDLALVASTICDVPVAMVSLIDSDRQWFKAKVGVDVCETTRESALCSHTILQSDLLEVEDTTKDCRFNCNPFVTGEPKVRFYAGAPLIVEGGCAVGTICIIDLRPRRLTDVQRKALAALGRQAVALLNLHRGNARLETLSRQKDDFLRIASHDLKNPLTTILAVSSSFAAIAPPGSVVTGQLANLLGGVRRQADTMRRIIADYLDFQAAEDGQLRIDRAPVDLNALAEEVVGDQRAYAEKKDIQVELRLHGEPATLHADAARLVQVMHNLVGNAIKFSQPETAVEVSTAVEGSHACFRVRDAGPGLTDDDRQKLFTKYARLANKPTGGEKSSGLGLSICKALIDLHDGHIGADNNDGQGTTFWFRIARQ